MELPEDTKAQLRSLQVLVEKFENTLSPVLDLTPKDLEQLEPLEAAQVQMAMAQAANALFKIYLMSVGTDPSESSVNREEERLRKYSRRLAVAMNEHEVANSKRSLAVDVGAANRFIEHAIPDLTDEQKTMLRDAGKAALKEKAEADAAAAKGGGKKRSKPSSGASGSTTLSGKATAEDFLDSVLGNASSQPTTPADCDSPAMDLKAKKKRKKKKKKDSL